MLRYVVAFCAALVGPIAIAEDSRSIDPFPITQPLHIEPPSRHPMPGFTQPGVALPSPGFQRPTTRSSPGYPGLPVQPKPIRPPTPVIPKPIFEDMPTIIYPPNHKPAYQCPPHTAAKESVNSVTSSRTLRLTKPLMRGSDVIALQRALKRRGYTVGPVDGIFGPVTTRALKTFQYDVGLPANGVADSESLKKLTG